MRRIGFLHTSAVHLPVFEALIDELAIEETVVPVSAVDESLLERARATSPTDPAVMRAVEHRLTELRDDEVEVVVCTCSTIGGVAEEIGAALGLPVVRVDRAMAERAIAIGGRVVVLAALESTVAPTEALLRAVAGQHPDTTVEIDVRVVPRAWERFEAGDLDGYRAIVADAIVRAGDDADVIVLAQASMATAADGVSCATPVLSSPRLAVAAVLE